ncbi:MAG: hypothetical protein DRJ08_07240 [Acidobacteria bacterium]|nr:MAG: hypothetical protein DRJ08_07240 [Acidobacteriota bacterium]
MNCLNSVEMMELLYGEADPATLHTWRKHLAECPDCRNAYWQLKDTSDWFRKKDSGEVTPLVILMAPPSSGVHKALKFAAAAVLAVCLGFAGLYVNRFQQQTQTLLARQQQVEQKIRNTSLEMQDTNRNQYMMLLALKDYLDKNYQTRKVSYEQFR